MKLISWLHRTKNRRRPLIEVRINRAHILHNLSEYKKTYPTVEFAPVLKSNAYGHGLIEVAQILDSKNLTFFVVDSYFEAVTLRNAGIKTPILVIGYTENATIVHNRLAQLAFTITSNEQLHDLVEKLTHRVSIHVKIDTGMHRQGLTTDNLDATLTLIKNSPNLVVQGVCSHLADADAPNSLLTEQQIAVWNQIVDQFRQRIPDIKYYHLTASTGARYLSRLSDTVARLGIGLYGIDPSNSQKLDLMPALEVRSVLSSIKELHSGESVGYGQTFITKQPMTIATVPVGYFEGVDRRLSNKGCYLVKYQTCPIIGLVSMNTSSIDVSRVSNPKLGDPVIVISSQRNDPNSIENMAKNAGTLAHELLVHIPQHLRRTVI